MIEQLIADKILKVSRLQESTIVAFGGAADLGKSYLANKVAERLNDAHITTSHLTLDSFLMDRAERKKRGVSGYDERAHDIDHIVSTLENWVKGREIKFRPYDHRTGRKSQQSMTVGRSKVLLMEGLFSLHESIRPFIDLSFFLYTNDDKLKEIRLEADLVKRGYSPEYSEKIYEQEFELYKKNIEPYKTQANFKLFLQEKWHYVLEE